MEELIRSLLKKIVESEANLEVFETFLKLEEVNLNSKSEIQNFINKSIKLKEGQDGNII